MSHLGQPTSRPVQLNTPNLAYQRYNGNFESNTLCRTDTRDSWSDITDILSVSGVDVRSPVKKLSPPSPLYNRDLPPYSPRLPSDQPPPSPNHQPAREDVEGGSGSKSPLDDVEEMVAMCSEYERQAALERSKPPSRIITNGSLPRDSRRAHSTPPASPLPPPRPPLTLSDLKIVKNGERIGEDKMPHSYENVVITSGSPRPRIKTIASMENHGKEHSFEKETENKIPLCLDMGELQMEGPVTGWEERRPSIAEVTANTKYSFLGFDPRQDTRDGSPDYDLVYTPRDETPRDTPPPLAPQVASPQSPVVKAGKVPSTPVTSPDYDSVYTPGEENPLTLPLNTTLPLSPAADSLRRERDLVLYRLADLKTKLSDLEMQEEEILREAEIESALVMGEINALKEKYQEDEARIAKLKVKIRECDDEMAKCLAEQEESQRHFKLINEKNLSIIQTLEKQVGACNSTDLRNELMESLSQQIELLDAEKKVHEDLEFRLLEEEACWLSRKEELQRELSDTSARFVSTKDRLAALKSPASQISNPLHLLRVVHLKAMDKDRNRLKEIHNELEKLSKMSVDSLDTTVEEVEVVDSRGREREADVDRISRVTSGTRLDVSNNTLGRRTIASLQEIERNRQLHLATQGSLVIEEERQRVEELKRRVQEETRAEWERQRSLQSLSSVTSEETSPDADHPARDSGLGSDEPDKRSSPDIKPVDSENVEEQAESRDTESPLSRPLSETSACSEDIVRRRPHHNPNIQRPLTRYLPIRGGSLDLRQHISEAGHQVDLVSGVMLDSVSCRGFLHKLGSAWRKWNKRWFVFDRTKRSLAYYSDKTERKLRGGAYFQAIEEVYVDHQNSVKSPRPKVTFVVKSANRMFYLVAPSPEAMRIWVDVIFTGAEGYQQFAPN